MENSFLMSSRIQWLEMKGGHILTRDKSKFNSEGN